MLNTPQKRGKAWPSSFLIGQTHLRVHGCRTTAHQLSRPSLLRLQIMYDYSLPTRLNANTCTAPPAPNNAILQSSCAGMRTEKSPQHNDAKKNDPAGDTVYSSNPANAYTFTRIHITYNGRATSGVRRVPAHAGKGTSSDAGVSSLHPQPLC